MSMPVRVGIAADAKMLSGPFEQRRSLLRRVVRSGLDHVFMPDHVSFHTGLGMDGLIQAAMLTAMEPNLTAYVAVYLLALRHPVPVARQIATLCESAPGRLVLGVGVGGEDRHEIEVCSVDPRTRGRRTNESLVALRDLLRGKPVSYECEFFSFTDALIRPAPKPAVPITVGGRSDAAVRRAARLGDGWIGAWCSSKRYGQVVTMFDELACDAGREQAEWRHGLQTWVGIDDDRAKARERLAPAMESFYRIPYERFEKYCPYGSAAEIAAFFAPYVEAGCREFNLAPVAESTERSIELLAQIKEILNRFSEPACE